jgi:drug/metabolite transporter (DMT)-like permease
LGREKVLGLALLTLTTALWGTSFSFIKLSVENVSSVTYTSYRCLLSVALLAPLALAKGLRRGFDRGSYRRGLAIGVAYTLGLLLQAEGTRYTTPSVSAFLTALNSVNVHVYAALVERRYSPLDAVAIALATAGLYVISRPTGGLGLGEVLLLLGSVAWAAQVILVSAFGLGSPLELLLGTFTPGLLLVPLDLAMGTPELGGETLLYLTYLALVCSITAILLQILGQRYVSPVAAAVVFLAEPVFALAFSLALGLEEPSLSRGVGGGLIVAGTYVATLSELRRESRYRASRRAA